MGADETSPATGMMRPADAGLNTRRAGAGAADAAAAGAGEDDGGEYDGGVD